MKRNISDKKSYKFLIDFVDNYTTSYDKLANAKTEEEITPECTQYVFHPEIEFANAIIKTFEPEFCEKVGKILTIEASNTEKSDIASNWIK